MAVPFGVSVGDFIAFINTTAKIVNALKDSTGARQDYQGVARELESLELALVDAQNIRTDDPQTEAALQGVISNCARTVQDFLGKTKKYDLSLGPSTASRNKWKDSLRKIQWALYSKEDVRKFQMQLYAHAASLNILISRINHSATTAVQQEQSDALIRIESKIENEQRQATIMQALVLSAISQCWTELRQMAALIIFGNFRIFGLIANYCQMPAQIAFDRPVQFQDAHGRCLPLQMIWVDTWEHFETMLRWKFTGMPGLKKIEHGEYVLSDQFGKRDVDRKQSIHAVFRPGRRIDMSMLFELSIEPKHCPKCDCEVVESSDFHNHWYIMADLFTTYSICRFLTQPSSDHCGLYYSRLKPVGMTNARETKASASYEYLSVAEAGPRLQRQFEPATDVVSDFTRVRIIELDEEKPPTPPLSTPPQLPLAPLPDGRIDLCSGSLETILEEGQPQYVRNDLGDAGVQVAIPTMPPRSSRVEFVPPVHYDSGFDKTAGGSFETQRLEAVDYDERTSKNASTRKEASAQNQLSGQEINENRLRNRQSKPVTQVRNRGILKKPTLEFPEQPDFTREGVTSSKAKTSKGIPPNARWTKIDRRLVNPAALEKAGERFEEQKDAMIVLRVLTHDEIQALADLTKDIRDERYKREGHWEDESSNEESPSKEVNSSNTV
ncbi:MAG: hypothetical protein M1820_010167 [Bogoriella megaspora]|nr:MAG: hypothetical protein M1820_010167 [Bogoriella megaspora]